jgi:hypothetical protein
MIRLVRMVATLAIATSSASLVAGEKEDPSRLTVNRIFGAREFEPDTVSIHWLATASGSMYTALEPSKGPAGGQDLVRHNPSMVSARFWSAPSN